MVTKRQLDLLENKIKKNNIKDSDVYNYDYSKLSDKELRRIHQIGLKAEREGISLAEEMEVEKILGSVYIGSYN